MDRDTLIQHLRTAHGYADEEPGGKNNEEGVVGFITPLDQWGTEDLNDLHEDDHDIQPGGGGPNPHQHTERK